MDKHNFNKLALGHHYDDVVETFLMSMIYSGQMTTIHPRRFLDEKKVYLIRPLIYLRKKEIVEAQELYDYQELETPCPVAPSSQREQLREKFSELFNNKQLFHNIAATIREDTTKEFWPAEIEREELVARLQQIWGEQ